MKFNIRKKDDIAIIALDGEMVGGPDAAQLTDRLRELIEKGITRVVVDMENVSWMNSSGLGILIGGLTTIRNSGGDLKLLHLSSKLQELLRITKLRCVFDVFDKEDEAIASFA